MTRGRSRLRQDWWRSVSSCSGGPRSRSARFGTSHRGPAPGSGTCPARHCHVGVRAGSGPPPAPPPIRRTDPHVRRCIIRPLLDVYWHRQRSRYWQFHGNLDPPGRSATQNRRSAPVAQGIEPRFPKPTQPVHSGYHRIRKGRSPAQSAAGTAPLHTPIRLCYWQSYGNRESIRNRCSPPSRFVVRGTPRDVSGTRLIVSTRAGRRRGRHPRADPVVDRAHAGPPARVHVAQQHHLDPSDTGVDPRPGVGAGLGRRRTGPAGS